MTSIIAIDPGTTKSGWVRYDTEVKRVISAGVTENDLVFSDLVNPIGVDMVLIEAMVVYKPSVYTTETLVWSGQFAGAARVAKIDVQLVYRPDIQKHFLGKTKKKGCDSRIRTCLIDRLGDPGVKRNPGSTYGVTADAWQALAVAVAWQEGVPLRTKLNSYNTEKKSRK